MFKAAVLSILLVFSTVGAAGAAPARVTEHRATHRSNAHRSTTHRPTHRRAAKREKPAVKEEKPAPKRVCTKTVVRVRTGKVLELVPKLHCF